MRAFLKTIFPQSFFPFLRSIDKYIINATYCYLAVKRFIYRDKLNQVQTIFQSIPIFKTQILFDSEPDADLTVILDNYGISYKSGRHSVYISEKADLEKINRELIDRNLPAYGLKILKSRELSPDETPYYTSRILAPASTYCSMRAVGSVFEKVIVSNLLHAEGVAPRVYDLVVLKSENGVCYYAFIVQHIEGPVVHGKEGVDFLQRLKTIFKNLGISVVSISEHCDLRPPYFRDNIIKNGSSNYYVDIQNFAVTDLHSVQNLRKNVIRRYSEDKLSTILSSEIIFPLNKSNKKGIIFLQHLDNIFKRGGIQPQHCFFIDSCSGLGVGLLSALSLGGQWGVLLRHQAECSDLRTFHYLRGNTRFDCISDLESLKIKIGEYNFSDQHVGIICDTVSSEIEAIVRWGLCTFIIVIRCSKERQTANTEFTFGDITFDLTEQIVIDEDYGTLMISLYMSKNQE